MYLMKTGDFPFTAAQLREAIGLKSDALDPMLSAGIASACIMSEKVVREEEWLVPVGTDPSHLGNVAHVGKVVHGVGSDPRLFYPVSYKPSQLAIDLAFARAQRWALNQHDVAMAIAGEKANG